MHSISWQLYYHSPFNFSTTHSPIMHSIPANYRKDELAASSRSPISKNCSSPEQDISRVVTPNLNRIGSISNSSRLLHTFFPALSLLGSPQKNITKGIGKVSSPELDKCTPTSRQYTMYYQLEYIDSATSRARRVSFSPFLLTSPRKFYLLS